MSGMAVMAALRLESGVAWGDAAHPWQLDAAKVMLDPTSPPYRWDSRPRGASKTSDAAGIVLASVTTILPPGSRVYCFAADRDQARLLVDALNGFVMRTPELASVVDQTTYRVTTRTGSSVEVMSADAASSWGILPSMVVLDELTQWPTTNNARNLWESIFSSLGKVPKAKMLCISTSGDPAHWSRRVYEAARKSALWTVQDVPGPVPWVSSEYLAEQQAVLPESSYRRLHLNQWCASEDRLTTPEDVRACVGHSGVLPPETGRRYVAGLDVGLVSDRSVLTIAHVDLRPSGPVVVVDRQWTWAGSKANPVLLTDVEAIVAEALRNYGGARLYADPYQAVHLCQRLRARGVHVEEFSFSSASVGRLALTLYRVLRDRAIDLPDDEELLTELSRVRLVESAPGAYRIDHDRSEHDDRVISLALCVLHLVERPLSGGWIRTYTEQCSRCDQTYPISMELCPGCGEPRPKSDSTSGWASVYAVAEPSPIERIMRSAMPMRGGWFGGGGGPGAAHFGGGRP